MGQLDGTRRAYALSHRRAGREARRPADDALHRGRRSVRPDLPALARRRLPDLLGRSYALEQALYDRRLAEESELIHHSDRGVQSGLKESSERLSEAGIEPSVGSVGDSYDNALVETIIGLYKTELIRQRGPWKNIDDVEYATLEWINWFKHRRLFQPIGDVPPAEFEMAYYRQQDESAMAA